MHFGAVGALQAELHRSSGVQKARLRMTRISHTLAAADSPPKAVLKPPTTIES